MVLDIINSSKENYKKLISDDPRYDELYKWELLKKFQDNWDINATDFAEMYDRSLDDSISTLLWVSSDFRPKEVMLEFIKFDEKRVRLMFRALFEEGRDVAVRIDAFAYESDRFLQDLKKVKPEITAHFHDGFRIISVYLSFRFPDKYSIYKYTEFKKFMDRVRAKSIPSTKEIGRFFKVINTINMIISKDEKLLEIHNKLISDKDKYYQGKSLFLAQDFYWCCARLDL